MLTYAYEVADNTAKGWLPHRFGCPGERCLGFSNWWLLRQEPSINRIHSTSAE